jgi:hypothetical protein
MSSRALARTGSVVIFACVALFIALLVPAMSAYPGGTWWDKTTHGYSFWDNFLCDLEARIALDGSPNPLASRLSQAAMLTLVGAFVPFWPAVARVVQMPRLGRLICGLGWAAVAGMVAVVLMPSDRFGALHGIAVLVAGAPGFTAVALSVAGLLAREPRPRVSGWLGAAMLVFGLADFALYAWHFLRRSSGQPLTAGLQKIAVLFLLAWMLAVAAKRDAR